MMRVADMTVMEVRVDVGENDIVKVNIGDSADVEVDAYNNRKFKGIVTQIAASTVLLYAPGPLPLLQMTLQIMKSASGLIQVPIVIWLIQESKKIYFSPRYECQRRHKNKKAR